MIEILEEKDQYNRKILIIPESEISKKEAKRYGVDLDGDIVEMTDGKIFRFPIMR